MTYEREREKDTKVYVYRYRYTYNTFLHTFRHVCMHETSMQFNYERTGTCFMR
jgi:hypothetical protein